jgi:hypothetical protein
VGQILRRLYERQLDGEITTRDQGIDLARAEIDKPEA